MPQPITSSKTKTLRISLQKSTLHSSNAVVSPSLHISSSPPPLILPFNSAHRFAAIAAQINRESSPIQMEETIPDLETSDPLEGKSSKKQRLDVTASVESNNDSVQNSVFAVVNSSVDVSVKKDEEVLPSSSNSELNDKSEAPFDASGLKGSNNYSDPTSLPSGLDMCASEADSNKPNSPVLVNTASDGSCITEMKEVEALEESDLCGKKRKRVSVCNPSPSEEGMDTIVDGDTPLACQDAAPTSEYHEHADGMEVLLKDNSSNGMSVGGILNGRIHEFNSSAEINVPVSDCGSCPVGNELSESSTGAKEDKISDEASVNDKSCTIVDKITELFAVSTTTEAAEKQEKPSHMLASALKPDTSSRKKLLILDINGLLVDIVPTLSEEFTPDTTISGKAVFKRPHCDDFLQFCFEKFEVGIWSSRTRKNVELVIDFLLGPNKEKLLFCWDQSHCTETGYNTIHNQDKPLLLKEIRKLWTKQGQDLPWERGDYNESNTLLLDDSPYKGLRNPPYTAIYPYPYEYRDIKDRSLGPTGDLRIYLERLARADNVQSFVRANPFGQRPITRTSLSWPFYSKIAGEYEQSPIAGAPMPLQPQPWHDARGTQQSRMVRAPMPMHSQPWHDARRPQQSYSQPWRNARRTYQSHAVGAPVPVQLHPWRDNRRTQQSDFGAPMPMQSQPWHD
ncbi:hypothetical protein AKJ16_DCAP01043 [Drosera capensis]